jgi:hypothetical protein
MEIENAEPLDECELGGPHKWQWTPDWYGDPGVIGGVKDCSHWRCTRCGEEDYRQPPTNRSMFEPYD